LAGSSPIDPAPQTDECAEGGRPLHSVGIALTGWLDSAHAGPRAAPQAVWVCAPARMETAVDPLARPATTPTGDVVAAAYRAFATRDVPSLLALLAPDVSWGQPDNPHIPSAGTRRGIDGVLEWLGIGNATEDVEVMEPRRILVDGDMAAVIGFMRVVVRATGAAYEMDFVHVIEVRDGRVVRFQEFFDTWMAAQAFIGAPALPTTARS
jgi:ketosteroid isomerase-like protein